ncbi:hypothetical protein XENOCAPTIV_018740, partial [Xenoophorus captivus]
MNIGLTITYGLNSGFCYVCLPGAGCERPLSNRGEIKRFRLPPSGHAPAHPPRCLCDRPVLPSCRVI